MTPCTAVQPLLFTADGGCHAPAHDVDRQPEAFDAAGRDEAALDDRLDTAEDDSVPGFAVPAADWSAARTRRSFARSLLSVTALSWVLSVAAHAAVVAVAVLIIHNIRRPAEITFAYGDASPEVGLRFRDGRDGLPPGWDGAPAETPGVASAAALPSPSVADLPVNHAPAGSEESPAPEMTPPPPLPQIAPPVPAVEHRLSTTSAIQTPLPTLDNRPVVPEPAESPTDHPQSTQMADNHGGETSGEHRTTSDLGDQSSSAAGGTETTTADAGGGDGSPGGQGGAATGAGGTAATGLPGIPAGVRSGKRLPTPVYPELSRRRGEQGTVELAVEILANGSVGQIRVVSDGGSSRLAKAAIDSLRGYSFRPAMENGLPVRSELVVPFNFRLR